jgi:catechol 2,3-dioxygenase-like lactoylglutathione lyase family enzyme
VVEQARRTAGCLDFALSADLVDAGRVNVFERWRTRAELAAFRGSGPSDDQQAALLAADVAEYEVPDEAGTAADRPTATLTATVLDCPDPRALARFYQHLLGWPLATDDPEWATLRPGNGSPGLSFQRETGHVPPTWPAAPGEQRMQVHLDIAVDDLPAAVASAVAAGATEAEFQPQDHVRVLLDPAGHPFCLYLP